jgi:mono/diheme cytochrome c family protein
MNRTNLVLTPIPRASVAKRRPRKLSDGRLSGGLRAVFCSGIAWCLVVAGGCQKSPPPEFQLDRVEWLKENKSYLDDGDEFAAEYLSEIPAIMEAMFGTPEHAWFPFTAGMEIDGHSVVADVVSPAHLRMAAGAVASGEDGRPQGLYREHCAQCHGVTGNGAGPTAGLLYPYPRDFRLGKFKFKSTPQRHPPTDDDLRRTLKEGIPGTAMPSFGRMSEKELNALIDYVKYLSIRGKFEKYLMMEIQVIDDDPFLTEDQIKDWMEPVSREQKVVSLFSSRPVDEAKENTAVDLVKRQAQAEAVAKQIAGINDGQFLDYVVNRWATSETSVTPVPSPPAKFDTSHSGYDEFVELGRTLYLNKGGCVQCHGKDARGIGDVEDNYDDWTKNWATVPGVDLTDSSTFADFKKAGAMTPRMVSPRNLRLGVYRGGGEPEQIYRRIANGIEGTPMPAGTALSDEEKWALVAYVRSLPETKVEASK